MTSLSLKPCDDLSCHSDAVCLSALQRRLVLCSFALFLFLRVVAMFTVPMTDTTEARYAEIARKMVETGDWITPQFDYGVPFWGKPPLHTWASAVGMKLFGVNEFGARIFIFISGCGLLALIYQWVKKERGRDMALLAVTITMGSAIYFVSMASVMTDLVMLFGTGLSMIAFWNALGEKGSRNTWGYIFFVGLAIGLLAKGPVATVLTGVPIGLWVLVQNRWKLTWARIPWIKGTLLMLALAGPWYLMAEIKTPGFLHYFIIGEHFERFLVPGWKGDLYGSGHAEPRGMIWIYWVLTLLPWTPFLLASLRRFRAVASGFRASSGSWAVYLLCWTLSPMLFFTMATNIIPTYVISGIPAACILGLELWVMTTSRETAPSRSTVRFFGATILLSTAIFVFVLLSFGGLAGKPIKRTQKYLVAEYRARSGDEEGSINYWNGRHYSAEFYAGGKVRVLKENRELLELNSNGEKDFIVVRTKDLAGTPPLLRDGFKNVYESNGYALMEENLEQSEVGENETRN